MTALTFTTIPAWLPPDHSIRHRALVDNPATLYGFPN
jgi:hypothetical protein